MDINNLIHEVSRSCFVNLWQLHDVIQSGYNKWSSDELFCKHLAIGYNGKVSDASSSEIWPHNARCCTSSGFCYTVAVVVSCNFAASLRALLLSLLRRFWNQVMICAKKKIYKQNNKALWPKNYPSITKRIVYHSVPCRQTFSQNWYMSQPSTVM